MIGAALAYGAGDGGHAWALLQYVLGFRQLGFEVAVLDRFEPDMLGALSQEGALASTRRSGATPSGNALHGSPSTP